RRSPGLTIYEPLTLVRRRTHDTSFEEWANKVYNFGAGMGKRLRTQRASGTIIHRTSQIAMMSYFFKKCLPLHK
ncbi:MAG: phage tail protein, partial [Candidatus Aminicenantales bacterium]